MRRELRTSSEVCQVLRHRTKRTARRGPSTLHKALDVLEALHGATQGMGITELAARVGAPKSTVHRIITGWETRGYIRQNLQTEKYRLDVKVFELGCAAVDGALIETARPYMREVLGRLNETVSLAILERTDCLFLEELKSSQPVAVQTFIGARVPAHCAAAGKVLLAFNSDAVAACIDAGLRRYTARTVVAPDEFKRQLEVVRSKGYAVVREEWRPDIAAAAAPVWDRSTTVIAALVVTAPASRVDRQQLGSYVNVVRAAAAKLSRALGFRRADVDQSFAQAT